MCSSEATSPAPQSTPSLTYICSGDQEDDSKPNSMLQIAQNKMNGGCEQEKDTSVVTKKLFKKREMYRI